MLTAHFHDSLDDIDAVTWNALAGSNNPFIRHEFLAGMERHGCIQRDWGWAASHVTLHDGEQTVAAAPLYLKGNSHGEFIFDWNWAGAFERAGGQYYPKLLCAVPYSPVTGPRLLAATTERKRALVAAIGDRTAELGLSSAHVNFLTEADTAAFDALWLARFDWQFLWHNAAYRDFEDFLAALRHKKRKNIRSERRQVASSGMQCRMQRGDTLDAAQWHQVHQLYLDTFESKGNLPTLTLAFFRHLATTLGDGLQVALACDGDHIVAMAVFLHDGETLYGRYWGSHVSVPALHFELCYYQGIEYAIGNGLTSFSPGAQGRHKMARGFLPVRTQSRHFLHAEGFRRAVAAALEQEAEALEQAGQQMRAHSPYHADQ